MQTQLELFPRLPLLHDPDGWYKRYQKYLRSHFWTRYVVPATFEAADWRCQAMKPGCKGVAEECHHTTYVLWPRGLDRPGDSTMAVCRSCHRWIHSHPIMLPDPANDNEPQLQYEDVA
jgi:hypothetical protein